jgi:hypothetical protein
VINESAACILSIYLSLLSAAIDLFISWNHPPYKLFFVYSAVVRQLSQSIPKSSNKHNTTLILAPKSSGTFRNSSVVINDMARAKSNVITAHQLPESLKTGLTVNSNHSMETTSESSSSLSSASTCPHCSSILTEMSPKVSSFASPFQQCFFLASFTDLMQDFNDHVASCTRQSTATDDDDTSDSSLTPPPDSPAIIILKYGKGRLTKSDSVPSVLSKVNEVNDSVAKDSEVSATIESDDEPEVKPILAYDTTTFDYYDKIDDREDSVITRPNSEEPEIPKNSAISKIDGSNEDKLEAKRFPFPKFTSIEDFEDYVANVDESSYEDLYDRTSYIASVLVDYQKEWDEIEKEIYIHESYVKAQAKKVAEAAKYAEEEKAKVEDQKYLEVAEAYKTQLKLSRSDWEQFLEQYDTNNAKENDLVERLRSLRLPNFISAIHKRQKGREPELIKLVDRPLMAERITKEELAMDKRKRGRLIDQITFEDMKHADVYGFNYSSQLHHVGNQPQPTYSGKLKGRGDASEEGRSRSQRNKQQKSYDAERSNTPETENDELPAKRARKPRMNLDMTLEPQGRTRTGPGSRSATPAIRTFPSGKRVGRPPAKSKLADVHLPPLSASPTYENVSSKRELEFDDRENLQQAAASLFNQTHGDDTPSTNGHDSTGPTTAEPTRPSSSSSMRSPKKRKKEAQYTDVFRVAAIPIAPENMQNTPILPPQPSVAFADTPPSSSGGVKRKRKPKEPEIDESLLDPEAAEALRKKRAKSAKLSESLRKRWEAGAMAGAMESRKVTNAAKKAAKINATTGGSGVASATPPIVPGIAPNIPLPMDPAQHPPIIPATAVDAPPAKRKYVYKNPKKPLAQTLQPVATPPPDPAPPSAEKVKSATKGKKRAPPPLTTRLASSRARKPARRALGMDGADDEEEEEEIEQQLKSELKSEYKSEYDHFQALTSPGSPVVLGKRNRRSKINLAAAMHDDDLGDDDDYSS